jgi:hypothetical protein
MYWYRLQIKWDNNKNVPYLVAEWGKPLGTDASKGRTVLFPDGEYRTKSEIMGRES